MLVVILISSLKEAADVGKRNDETAVLVGATSYRSRGLSEMLAQIVCLSRQGLTESGLFSTQKFYNVFY